jgi:hypothetical protein
LIDQFEDRDTSQIHLCRRARSSSRSSGPSHPRFPASAHRGQCRQQGRGKQIRALPGRMRRFAHTAKLMPAPAASRVAIHSA